MPASPHGNPSLRRNVHHTLWPLSQHGSSNDQAGMMQRLPSCHERLNDALPEMPSYLALLVEKESLGDFANQGTSPPLADHQLAANFSSRPNKRPERTREDGWRPQLNCGFSSDLPEPLDFSFFWGHVAIAHGAILVLCGAAYRMQTADPRPYAKLSIRPSFSRLNAPKNRSPPTK